MKLSHQSARSLSTAHPVVTKDATWAVGDSGNRTLATTRRPCATGTDRPVDIEYNTVYQAGPTDGLDLFTDLDFLRDYATELGVTSHEADVSRIGDSRSVTLRLVAPTDEVSLDLQIIGGSGDHHHRQAIMGTRQRRWLPQSPARRSDCKRAYRQHQRLAESDS